jgi:integrase
MGLAGITGAPATAKGLRHAAAVAALLAAVPLHLVQRWLGHVSPETTQIYLDVVGLEERQFAARMWSGTDTRT